MKDIISYLIISLLLSAITQKAYAQKSEAVEEEPQLVEPNYDVMKNVIYQTIADANYSDIKTAQKQGYSYSVKDSNVYIIDLNYDGLMDAVAIVEMRNENTKQFKRDLAIFINQGISIDNNQPSGLQHYIDLNANGRLNYVSLETFKMNNGYFTITAKGYSNTDTQCCPTNEIRLNFTFENNEIIPADLANIKPVNNSIKK